MSQAPFYSWIVDATATPAASSATQISFVATNPDYLSEQTYHLRINGSSLAYNETTGALSGTITTLEIYDATNSNVMQTITIPASQQTTIAATLSSFLNTSYAVANLATDWDLAGDGFAVFGGGSLASDGTSFIMPLMDAEFNFVGSLYITGTGLDFPALLTIDSVGSVATIAHYDANGVLVAGHTADYTANPLSLANFAYAIDLIQNEWGNGDIFYEMLTKGSNTITVNDDYSNGVHGGQGNDTITGGDQGDGLYGGAGNDTLNGGGSTDLLKGGTGNDTLNGDFGDDMVFGEAGNDTLNGGVGNDDLDGGADNDTLNGGDGNDLLLGGAGNDEMYGNADDDELDGGAGNDDMYGGTGNDTYFVNSTGDRVLENASSGVDTIISTISISTLALNVERLELAMGAGNLNGTGNHHSNTIIGNDGNNVLNGGLGGSDTLSYETATGGVTVSLALTTAQNTGGAGKDTIRGFANLTGGDFNDVLTGDSAANVLKGGDGNDTLNGGSGNDTLYGGSGVNKLAGGLGDDLYIVENSTDVITEAATQGLDHVKSSVSFSIAAASAVGVENLTLTGEANINAAGNALSNVITGNTGDNSLDGGAGNDTLIGGGGEDTLTGGLGNDLFYYTGTETIQEADGQGTDSVISAISYELTAHVENLTLTGEDDVDGTGNDLDNVIIGNSGENVLSGGEGNDKLMGGEGNDVLIGNGGDDLLDGGAGTDGMEGGDGSDIYVIDDVNDVFIEEGATGTDTVRTIFAADLSSGEFDGIENVELFGTANVNATGDEAANVLKGNSGNNVLDGGTVEGADDGQIDNLYGGAGNDIYILGAGDKANELKNSGIDTIVVGKSWTLGADYENLTLTGTGDFTGKGNASANIIIGNEGKNTLDGSTGNDFIQGGAGNDTLIGGTGIDTVSYAYAAHAVEVRLAVTTAQNVVYGTNEFIDSDKLSGFENVIGSAFGDRLHGTTGANFIVGGEGADQMFGGSGNDTYFVDHEDDEIVELASGGTADLVKSSVSFSLVTDAVFIEHLTLIGDADINATGDGQNNKLTGNSGSNILTGGLGEDTLDGGLGADTMDGGQGGDNYYVDNAGDSITELQIDSANDVVNTTISFDLSTNGAHVEWLKMLGTGNLNAVGNAHENKIWGNDGNNIIDGGTTAGEGGIDDSAADTLIGGKGDDSYYVGAGDTVVELSKQGVDTVFTALETYHLVTYVENLTLIGTAESTGIGSSGNNVITGNASDNVLTGGAGYDTFVFNQALGENNIDQITDFSTTYDTIRLDNAIFTALNEGALSTGAFFKGAVAADTGDRIVYNQTTGALYYDADGSGSGQAVQFATLTANLSLTSADFIVV